MPSWRWPSPVRRAVPAVVGLLVVAGLLVPAAVDRAGAHSAADEVPPQTITVCRDSYGGGEVTTVDLRSYVRTVLAYEFGQSGPLEYLKAGAVAVKSYAWWHVHHPESDRCDISDGGDDQHFRPGEADSSDVTTRAVNDTWQLRLEEEGEPAFAQYCSKSCEQFADGEHLNQIEARDQAAAGWDASRILRHHYRGLRNLRLENWQEGFGMTIAGRDPHDARDDALVASVDGVPAGHPAARGHLVVDCTRDGQRGRYRIQTVPITDGDSGPTARFDRMGALAGCEETEMPVSTRLRINGHLVAEDATTVWKPWRSSTRRDLTRFETSDPVAASVAVSRAVFADAGPGSRRAPGVDDTEPLPGSAGSERVPSKQSARAAVIASKDRFAHALAATGLAGPDAPLLLNPGGEQSGLADPVAAEVRRVLSPGATVHLVGGRDALSERVANDRRLAGYRVVRHTGDGPVETALAVADAARRRGADTSSVLVAGAHPDGPRGWAAAAAGSAYAAARHHPVVLTGPNRLDGRTERWIESRRVNETVLLGGSAVVPADAEQRLETATTRVAGPNRAATAVAVADRLWTRTKAPTVTAAQIIDPYRTAGWRMALVGAVYAANRGTPELAVTTLVPRHTTGAWLDEHPDLPVAIVGDDRVVAGRAARDVTGR